MQKLWLFFILILKLRRVKVAMEMEHQLTSRDNGGREVIKKIMEDHGGY